MGSDEVFDVLFLLLLICRYMITTIVKIENFFCFHFVTFVKDESRQEVDLTRGVSSVYFSFHMTVNV